MVQPALREIEALVDQVLTYLSLLFMGKTLALQPYTTSFTVKCNRPISTTQCSRLASAEGRAISDHIVNRSKPAMDWIRRGCTKNSAVSSPI